MHVQWVSLRWNTVVNADNRTNGATSWLWTHVYELRFRCCVSTLHKKEMPVTDEDTKDDNEDGRVPITVTIHPHIPTAMETLTPTDD